MPAANGLATARHPSEATAKRSALEGAEHTLADIADAILDPPWMVAEARAQLAAVRAVRAGYAEAIDILASIVEDVGPLVEDDFISVARHFAAARAAIARARGETPRRGDE